MSSPVRVLTPEPLDSSISPEKSPDFHKKPRDTRMLSPEKSPIVIRKYTRSPDVLRRFDTSGPMKLRSPDLRMRPLEGIASLPQLKEGSLESSMEDLEMTPKPSPEREIKVSTPHSESQLSGLISLEGSPETRIKLLTPPKSSSRAGSKEGSPEASKLQSTPAAIAARLLARGSGEDKEASPPVGSQQQQLSDVESSLEFVSKLSEDTISAHSLEDYPESQSAHSKTGSEDINSSSSSPTRPLPPAPAISSRISRTTAMKAAHLKAASDDITAASAVSHRVRSNLMISQSLTSMDRVGVAPEPRLGGMGHQLKGGREARAVGSEPPVSIGEEAEEQIAITREEGVGEKGSEAIAAVISPTLKMADKVEDSGTEEPATGEEALFNMLEGRDKPVLAVGSREALSKSREDLTDSQEVMDEFDRILDGAEEMIDQGAQLEEGEVLGAEEEGDGGRKGEEVVSKAEVPETAQPLAEEEPHPPPDSSGASQNISLEPHPLPDSIRDSSLEPHPPPDSIQDSSLEPHPPPDSSDAVRDSSVEPHPPPAPPFSDETEPGVRTQEEALSHDQQDGEESHDQEDGEMDAGITVESCDQQEEEEESHDPEEESPIDTSVESHDQDKDSSESPESKTQGELVKQTSEGGDSLLDQPNQLSER